MRGGVTMREFKITDAAGGAAISVNIVPKASKTEIVGIQSDGAVKIRLMSPPVDGEANEELINFLADFLGCARKDIAILAGEESRKKIITIMNADASRINDLIHGAVPDGFVDAD